MTETEFLESIDCNFPFQDREACHNVVFTACEFSANAAFYVLDEIVRSARGVITEINTRQELITLLESSLKHPLVSIIVPVARRMVLDQELSVIEAIECMNAIRPYTGQYSALGLVYMSCDDVNGKADELFEEIRNSWKSA